VFLKTGMAGKVLAYSTTNGTQTIGMAKSTGNVVLASFANLEAVSDWLRQQDKDIVILCSGWKNSLSLEDTLCAGALVEALKGNFECICDASQVALSQWIAAKSRLRETAESGTHYRRLIKLKQMDDLQHCFTLNTSLVVPLLDGKGFRNLSA
jgi:2-phosphosulfolactate phosphatase